MQVFNLTKFFLLLHTTKSTYPGMKINLFTLGSLIIIVAFIGTLTSCKDKVPEQTSQKEVKQAVDTAKPKVIYKKPVEKKVAVKTEPNIYVVKKGEWLWDIARKEYGTAIGWFRIYEANREKIADPELIYPGQRFIIPEFTRRK